MNPCNPCNRRPAWRRLWPGVWLLAAVLLPAAAGPAAAQRQVSEEDFDRWVFQNDQNAAGARKRIDTSLTLHLQDIDRTCRLTEAQKKKLQLAGRGDVKRFFDRYEAAKQKFRQIKDDEQKFQEIWQDINPLQTSIQSGLFHEDSIFCRSLRHTLTAEQLPRYEAAARERRAFRHRTGVELAVSMIEQSLPLRDMQRQALVALLERELKPARKASQYEYYIIFVQMSYLPEDKLKPLFDATQWKAINKLRANYKGAEQWLKQSGQWPEDDDAAAAPPAAGAK